MQQEGKATVKCQDIDMTAGSVDSLLAAQLNCCTTSEQLKKLRDWQRHDVEKPVVYIGAGTCGLGAGAAQTMNAVVRYLTDNQIDAEVVEVGCIGLCAEEPLVDFQLPGHARISFRKVQSKDVPELMSSVFEGDIPAFRALGQFPVVETKAWDGISSIAELPFFAPQTRRVLANCGMVDPLSLKAYLANGGFLGLKKTLSSFSPAAVCDEVLHSGLRGRGGGGFPAGKKWQFALAEDAEQKYMICNADEGDPGAFMDRALIEGDPYRLLEGLAIASYAIGASVAYVYIRAEYPLAITRLQEAISRAREAGLLGKDILGSGFSLEIKIKKGAGAFVCGEETALIHSIEGKRGMPRPRPPFPAKRGLFDKPTCINNVETLANVPDILCHGADWFAGIGTAGSKGTKVFALSGKVVNTGLVEVAMGTRIREIVFDIGGGTPGGHQFKAVQIGGPSGGCIPEDYLDIEIDYESLKTVGAMMGSGGLVVMDEKTCMVDLAKYFMDFIQRESCGKCIPCREGTRRMLDILERITSGRQSESGHDALDRFRGVMYLERLAGVIQDTSLCGLGQTAPNPVLSTLRWFRSEYEEHIYNRHCPAGVCTELLEYSIDADKCTGCTLCARKCPADAIMGAKKAPHYVIQDRCIRCGACLDVCKFDAVKVN